MKRYIIFAGYNYYPNGGIKDFKDHFDTEEEYINYISVLKQKDDPDWIQVYDIVEDKMIIDNY